MLASGAICRAEQQKCGYDKSVDRPNAYLNFQGNGTQLVWINADSVQNSQTATMSVQSLAAVYDAYNRGVFEDLEMRAKSASR